MTANGKIDKGNKNDAVATLDEAMLHTGFGIYNIVHMLLSGMILMGVIVQSLLMGYVMPAAQCDLGLSLQQRGWLAAIPFLAIILTSYMWGWLADTRGRRFVMLLSMVLSALFGIVSSFAPNVLTFGLLSFLASVFMSGPSAVVYTYLGEFTNLRHRDKMVAFGSSFVGIGTVVLPAVSWLILPLEFSYPISFLDISYRPWRLLVVACCIPFMIGTIFLILAPESPKFLSASGNSEAALKVLKRIYSVNNRVPEDTFPVKSLVSEGQGGKSSTGLHGVLVSMRDQTLPLFRAPLLPWTLLACFVQFGIFANTNGFYVWFPTILNSLLTHDGDESRICDVLQSGHNFPNNNTEVVCDDTINVATFEMSIYIGLVFSSMYIIVGFLVDFVGKKSILLVLLPSTGLCGIGAHLASSKKIAVVLFAIFQMCGACIGLMNAVAVELFPTKNRAMAICLSMMMGRVGSMVGSNLIGFFLSTNCGLSFYLFGGVLIICALCCFALPGRSASDSAKICKAKKTEQTNETA
ncbi:uncharacterized protein LOC116769137 [Danaus plexippus]|uniref:uncharacterized protein LOC116769137 n=1 Tax=Danaus plexippus TaxID=13037 RepID=UPI002AAF493B|nr:uncharacterized protein LOC116769137 [Danaus plexippus]